jgi:acetyl esterase/lipase
MPVHPQVSAFLKALETQPAVDFATVAAATFRAAFTIPALPQPGDLIARVEDRLINGDGGSLRLRVYTPEDAGELPVTLYFYGGGFVTGRPEQTDHICCALARRAGTVVVSVDYRLAPEAPFPAAVDDAFTALRYIHRHASDLGGDASRIAVAGDSSGGNLAAVLAQQAKAEGIDLRHQLLFYPPLDAAGKSASYREMATGYGFTAAWMDWYWRQYLSVPAMAADVRVSPLRRADLRGLASATVFTAEYDILRDEGEAYCAALQAAGVPTQLKCWPGQIHGFLLMYEQFDDADAALDEAAAALRRALA